MFPVVEDPTAMVFSPSQLIGLSTPPTSERATPAIVYDQGTSGQTSVGETYCFSVVLWGSIFLHIEL